MSIKKQIILDEKDYDELVNRANLNDSEIKNIIANALTTAIEKTKRDDNKLIVKYWILLVFIILFVFAMGHIGGWLTFNLID